MRVSIVSTLHGHCGIAQYTGHFVDALRKSGVDAATIAEETWQANTPWYPLKILAQINRTKPDVVHIQHEYLLFGKGEYGALLIPLLLLLKVFHRAVILTLHSVISITTLTPSFFEEYTRRKSLATLKRIGVLALTKLLVSLSGRVIVHTHSAKQVLIHEYKVPSRKISVISHPSAVVRENHKPAEKITFVLFAGFVKPSKGIESLIQAMKEVHQNHPHVKLRISGEVSNHNPASSKYRDSLQELAKGLGISELIEFDFRFLPEREFEQTISSASIVVLPYVDQVHGESGVLWKVASFGKPVVVSKVPKFANMVQDNETALFFPPGDEASLAACIEMLLTNRWLAARIGRNLRKLAAGKTWKTAAQKMNLLYAYESKRPWSLYGSLREMLTWHGNMNEDEPLDLLNQFDKTRRNETVGLEMNEFDDRPSLNGRRRLINEPILAS